MCKLHAFENTEGLHIERKIGAVTTLIYGDGDYRSNLAEHLEVFLPALYLNQVRFFYDDHHRICSFYLWATLTEAVERRVVSRKSFWLHESEWNEGDRMWIVAFAARLVDVRHAVASVKADSLRRSPIVKSMRPRVQRPSPVRVWQQDSVARKSAPGS
ncbi:toxin-activating lysine-acyltransferase [Luteimonas sp. R10]|uniref:toxin-activating lysine-acyltransferase n=1 Tax=Luteimonas sp. R10 TaxID=3108176 RepID=UPI00388E9ABA